MNTIYNTLAQVRRDMERHLDAMRRPQGSLVRAQRAALIADMYASIERMEATIKATKGGV